jgi:hypothetical protein
MVRDKQLFQNLIDTEFGKHHQHLNWLRIGYLKRSTGLGLSNLEHSLRRSLIAKTQHLMLVNK